MSATPWLTHKEPRGPRAICALVLDHMRQAEAEATAMLQEGSPAARSSRRDAFSTGGSHVSVAPVTQGSLQRNVAKLFQDHAVTFRPLTFALDSVMYGMVGFLLKSLIEVTRETTFQRAGLQQLQVDVQFLRPGLKGFVGLG